LTPEDERARSVAIESQKIVDRQPISSSSKLTQDKANHRYALAAEREALKATDDFWRDVWTATAKEYHRRAGTISKREQFK
jgi:hypothetical protein